MPERKPIEKRDSAQFSAVCEALLQRGIKVRFRAQGQSMQPNILDGDALVVSPADKTGLRRGDVALTQSDDGLRAHRVSGTDSATNSVITRGDAGREDDGAASLVLGKIIEVERAGKSSSIDSTGKIILHAGRTLLHRGKQAAALRLRKLGSVSALFGLAMLFAVLLNAAPAAGQVFTITDTAAPTTVAPGGTVVYTQKLTSSGATITQPITVTENLPAGATFVSGVAAGHHTWTCAAAGAVITCTDTSGASYSAGNTTTFTITITESPTATNGSTIPNNVSAQGGNTGAPGTASAPVTVQTPDLSVATDTDAPDPVNVATNLTYTETVKNNSAVIAVGATLTQSTPPNTTFQSVTAAAGWTCGTQPAVGGTGNIICTANTSASAGEAANTTSGNFTVVVQVNSSVTSGSTITNSVTVSETGTDPTPGNNTLSTTTTVLIPDLSVATDTDAPDPVNVASNLTYTETVKNNSAIAAVGATLTQSTPANTTFQSVTAPTGWTCGTQPAVGGTGSIICTANTTASAGSAANTTSGNFTVVVQVNSSVISGSTITNSVTVSETGTDPTPGNNTLTTTTTVQIPDLSVTETAAPNPVATGSNITYTETVTNNTALAAVGATLTQSTPANTLFQSVTPPAGWTCGTTPAVNGAGSIICSATGTFAASTSVNFSVVVQVSPEAMVGSTITNSVTVSETGTDPTPGNNTATASVLVQGADLAMTQVASATAVAQGTTITYTETVTNNGPNSATGAVLYQQTPPNTTFSSMTPPTGWTCGTLPAVGASGQVICTASAAITSGTVSGNFVYVVTVGAATAAGTTIVNYADVTSSTTDSNSSNNATSTSVLVEIAADADLSLTMTASPTPAFISSPVSYTITINNLGLTAGTVVTVKDTVPATLVGPTATTTVGSCGAVTAGVITCTLGTVAYPLATPITITVTGTTPLAPTTMTNSATVSTTSTDPVNTNNTVSVMTVVQPLVCASPGKDGAGGTLNSVVNTYYAGVGTASAGATSITVTTPSLGASTQIGVGDLLLVMQMQAAQINSTNTTSYGAGMAGSPSGSTSLGTSGQFEFVTVIAVTAGTGTETLTIQGTGGLTAGLLNTYTSAVATATQGIQTFQVIRVPQYISATTSAGLTALAWNGAVGGVLVLDVASQLTLTGTVATDSLGFRGGGGIILTGALGTSGDLATDTVTASPATLPAFPPAADSGANGSKGEGIAGTPHWVAPNLTTITTASTAVNTNQAVLEGLPNGSFARGAPGNAGGGATDADPIGATKDTGGGNDQNSGGGAGGNGGAGGSGGFAWSSAGLVGGYGGSSFPPSTSAIVMGGGGGAGTTNNGSYWLPATDTGGSNCNATCTGAFSSGAAGGGIVIIHAGSWSGTGTITANGGSGLETENDGGGGGGAGGTILAFASSGTLTGLTAQANGGNGGTTWPEDAVGSPYPGNRHGPGAGGGGGVILSSSAPGTSSVLGGNPGVTTLVNDAYGATVGQPGVNLTGLTFTETPGTQAGAYCSSADLAVTDSAAPNTVLAGPGPGNVITYTQTVTNNGPFDALNAVFTENVPANTTFQSFTNPGGSGWTCTTPAVGATGAITCTNPDVANAGSTSFTLGAAVNTGVTSGTVITDIDNASSGTNDVNLANNTASAQTTVGLSTTADLSITNTATPNPVVAGNSITYTVVVTNNGAATAANVVFSEPIPANTTFTSATPTPATGWSCSVTAGTLNCTYTNAVTGGLVSGGTTSFKVILAVSGSATPGSAIADTATVSSTTTDPNPNNNSATANVVVASAAQADLAVTSIGTPNPVTEGANITYAQVVTNNGPAASGTATFTDTIPANTTFVSFTPPSGWNCGATIPAVGGTGTISCSIASLAVNATASFPLVVKVNLNTPTTSPSNPITNTANINNTVVTPCSSVTDPNCANNTAPTSVYISSPTQSDLAIVKTASPEPVDQGTNLTYTLQVTNNGPAIAPAVTVSDTLPGQVTYTSVTTTQGTCAYTAATTTVGCNLGSLSVGGLAIVTINAAANTFSSATLSTNTATVGPTTNDPNLTNNSSSSISTIAAATAVQLASFHAVTRQGGGILLEWKTREEIRNLGFNVFRSDAAGRKRLNPSIIAGSALLIRGGSPQHAAKTYQWLDPQGTAGSSYELEDVDLNGTRQEHGPITVDTSAPNSAPNSADVSQPTLLTQLNRSTAHPAMNKTRLLSTAGPLIPELQRGELRVSLDPLPAVKISVQTEGWYQVSKAQLVAAGLNPGADARTLQLYAEGVEQPMLILGAQAGPLGANDSIEFYGTGIDTPFSDARVYWLISGSRAGKRTGVAPNTSSGFAAPESFPFTVIRQDRTTYFATLLNGENNDNFFGDAVTSEPVNEELTVANADPDSAMQVAVDITLQGATDQQPHSVSVSFNGASIGEMDFANLANVTNTFSIDRSLLQNGENNVTLTALNGDNDVSVVQTVALHYPHTYNADANWLKATAPTGTSLHVVGFTSPQVQVFDITDPLAVVQLTGAVQLEGASYGITLGVPPGGAQDRTLLVFSSNQISAPSALTFHKPAELASQRSGSQMVIITHPDFQSSLDPLVKLHELQGLNVDVVTIDEIFDAFNYGERSPFAMRDFLQNAQTNWSTKPQYVLLMGDASLDPRNYLGLGDFDFVPTRMIETAAFKTASDDWFTDFQQTGYGTLAMGRIPVRTSADASLVVSKIVNYEKGIGAGPWNEQVLMIADQNIGADFSTASKLDTIDLPTALKVTNIFADGVDPTLASQQIQAALNSGALLVNYSGHGSVEQWSFSDLLDDSSASALSNGNQLPVYLMMDCLNGFFQDVYSTSLAESLLLAPNGGAVGVWASSGFTNQPPQATMNQALLHILKTNISTPIGHAIILAKTGITDADVRRTWIFFGDPAMRLQFRYPEFRRIR